MTIKLKLFSILFTILLLFSCKDEPKSVEPTNPEKTKETTVKKIKTEAPVREVKTEFGGIWINKKYVDKLLATKSPKKSQDVAPITMLVLPNTIKKEVKIIYGFHEGSTGKVLKKKDGFVIQIEEADDPILPFKFENNRIKIKNEEFVLLKDLGKKDNYYIVEQLLFSGHYDWNGKKVDFAPNGKITGLDNFFYYSVLIDYYDAGMQVDQIRLGRSLEDSKLYGFAFKSADLIIYELRCTTGSDDFCEVVKFGEKLYKLKKA